MKLSAAVVTLATAIILPGMDQSCGQEPAPKRKLPPAQRVPGQPPPAALLPADIGAPTALPEPGVRRALIVCGLTGDAEHRTLFAETVEKLFAGLTTRLGFAPEDVTIFFGDEATEKDGPALKASRGTASRERLAESAADLEQAVQPGDALWVFVFGHAHYDGRAAWLNLPEEDLNQVEFGKLFADIGCREQVFFITTAASGFFLKPLASPGRVVIVATEPDLEVNETLFPHKLVKALVEPPPMAEFDVDGDGLPTLLDAYLFAARETAKEYAAGELLATEHAMLDDDGDGRGTELQVDYLPVELGGRLRPGRPQPPQRAGDGARARGILLPLPPEAPAVEDAQP
ncbi:MAG TPA: hypothetical protein VGX76_12995 [Pirellulales bacterium]|nr:hypothetical protein [Pirellulales bacterium]